MLVWDFLRSAYDHALGRPKSAFPTRYHYIEILGEALSARGLTIRRFGQHCLVLSRRDGKGRLIIAVRYTSDPDLKLLQKAARQPGTRIAYLLDDDLWAMLEDQKLKPDYRARLQHFLDRHYAQLRPLLQEVIAPSPQILARMAELPGTYLPPAHLFPGEDLSHFNDDRQIRIVFLGTSTHGVDFGRIAPGISAALKANPKLHLTTLQGKRGGELLPDGPQVTHHGDMFFAPFQKWLSRQRFHIALAPYQVNPVNNGRSNLKFHQHALVGAAGLYTATEPFEACVKDGQNGLILPHTPEAWQEAILGLAADMERTRDMAGQGIAGSLATGSHDQLANLWDRLVPNG
ncbi:glycosyltransferase family protein [Roseibium suaedae]|uniref:Glycosyltransferase family 1 protein n=1 Tax=Roseibium suaedae TaxID=735517 RepID=A0A1M7P7D4_9HYPH|nr:hypothetical protein [Roseibium suaedae]SHN12624.1 hypothetical protein SAMN05444272_4172 [Roseibium suaedae]